MDRGDNQVEACEYIFGIIKAAIIQDIALNTFEDAERRQLFVEFVYLLVLGSNSFFLQAIRVESGLAVITDHEVFKSSSFAFSGHLLKRVAAIAPVAV
jgi:hypothetical protein